MKRPITWTMYLVVVSAATPALTQAPPPPVFDQLEFFEHMKAMLRRDGEASPWEVANGWLDAAEQRLAEGGRWSDQLFSEAGMAFLNGGWPLEAAATFQRLEDVARHDHVRRYAAYKAGEILLLDLRRHDEAAAAFERYRAMTFADGALLKEADTALGRFARAILYMGDAQRGAGDRPGAIEARASLLETPGAASLSDMHFARVCVENGIDAFAVGDVEGGRAWFDLLFAERPWIGMDDGLVVTYRLKRAMAGRKLSSIRDEATVHELRAIWEDPKLADIPEIMHAAHLLETVLRKRREYDARLEVLAAAWEHFNRREAAWREKTSPERFEHAELLFQTVATHYADELTRVERWDDVFVVGTDLLSRFPQTGSRLLVQRMVDEALLNK